MRKNSNLKVVTCVRYADDFQIFTNSYQSAIKLFHATENWLKERLGLDINPEKSKVINLKEKYSEFLGFKLKVVPRGKYKSGKPNYVVKSHIGDKAHNKIKANLKRLINDIKHPPKSKHPTYDAVCKYNSYVMGVHGYYKFATMAAADMKPLAFSVQKSLRARFPTRLKTAVEVKRKKIPYMIPEVIQKWYGKSKQLRYIDGCAVAPIGYTRHKPPLQKKRVINSYTVEGRAEIHRNLETVNVAILHYLMRNPIPNRSIEYNDNRLSLYSAQKGKCAVTGNPMQIGDIYCHHKIPRNAGGTDTYENLILVCCDAHNLIHATNSNIIAKYMEVLHLDGKQLRKLNKLRSLVNVENG